MSKKIELPESNKSELEMMEKILGTVAGKAMYACQILSDVQEEIARNPALANEWVNHAKIVLAPLIREKK